MEGIGAQMSAAKAAGVGTAAAGATAGDLALFGFNYNRAAFKFDQSQRWARFTSGRKMACEQTEMFRQDVEDLTSVAHVKLKTFGPIMTMSIGYCVTVLVEGRSGLKFPAPPTFVSGLYLMCLGVAFAFLTLSTWLVFHAALRAQVAAVQLRTRKVRVPVPTQRQLDNARRICSSYEEQEPYDIFKMPFVMPQPANYTGHEEEDVGAGVGMKAEGKKPAKKGKMKGKASSDTEADDRHKLNQVPAFKEGVPLWIDKEMRMLEDLPGASPSGFGREAQSEPFEHFELLRAAQKEWWSAEAYQRINMLYGMIHLLQAFGYWLIIHCITDLGLVWIAVGSCTGLNAAAFLIFRLDVLPEKGGFFPIELSGPIVSGISVTLSYAASPTQTTQDISRWVAGLVLVMHIIQVFRFYALAKPSAASTAAASTARESGGRIFNRSAACEAPSWLPQSFQVVMYLIAPPHPSKADAEMEKRENDSLAMGDSEATAASEVDMTPWYYTRCMLLFVLFGWMVLLIGRIVEGVMGERMLMTNPGAPPWTRFNQWYGWEFGPITSKHYAHVTPQRGHYSWQEPWGPNGQQELWPSDLFGFAPEADMWWSEDGETGAPFHGENTWYPLRLKAGTMAELHNNKPHGGDDHSGHLHKALPSASGSHGGHATGHDDSTSHGAGTSHSTSGSTGHSTSGSTSHSTSGSASHSTSSGSEHSETAPEEHSAAHSGEHRLLRGQEEQAVDMVRPLVPAAVQWPAMLEPQHVVCAPKAVGGLVAAFTNNGYGAAVPLAVASGRAPGPASGFTLQGLAQLGEARGMSWSKNGLLVVTDSGEAVRCPMPSTGSNHWNCSSLHLPKVPFGHLPAALIDAVADRPLQAAVAVPGGKISIFELATQDGFNQAWQEAHEVYLHGFSADSVPQPEVVSVTTTATQLLVSLADGVVHHWVLRDGKPALPGGRDIAESGSNRQWQSACALPDGTILRLASAWRRAVGGGMSYHPELFL